MFIKISLMVAIMTW